ncbi:MAG TPA: GtrA family protein [Pseudonocardia sp.]|nr:GtrA family protein [Pseudonocardia sp.]
MPVHRGPAPRAAPGTPRRAAWSIPRRAAHEAPRRSGWWTRRWVRELARFAAVGTASTALQAVLYLLLRSVSGPAGASWVALLVTTLVNTEAHRHLTFRAAADVGPWRAHLQAGVTCAVVYVVNLVLTWQVDALRGDRLLELAALTAVGAATGLLRFAILRHWVFRRGPAASGPAADGPAPSGTGTSRPGAGGPVLATVTP